MAEEKEIQVYNNFYVDGKRHNPASTLIRYFGFASPPLNKLIIAESQNNALPISNKQNIKLIIIENKSGDELFYKLDGSNERYSIKNKVILSQQPASILIDNDTEYNVAIEVTYIGENF